MSAPAAVQDATINNDSNHTVRVGPVSITIPTTDKAPNNAIINIVERKARSVVNFLRLCSRIMFNCGAVHCETNSAVVVSVVPNTVAEPAAKTLYNEPRMSTRNQQSNKSGKRNQDAAAINPPATNPATSSEYPSSRLTVGCRSMMRPDKRHRFLRRGHEQQFGWHHISHRSRPKKDQ